jgi:hypothetical protein
LGEQSELLNLGYEKCEAFLEGSCLWVKQSFFPKQFCFGYLSEGRRAISRNLWVGKKRKIKILA